MPSPSSVTVTHAPARIGSRRLRRPRRCHAATSIVTCPAPCRTAFSSRLARTWSSLSASTHISGRPVADAHGEPCRGPPPTTTMPATCRVATRPRSTTCRRTVEPAGVDPGDVEQLGDQPGDPVGVGVDGLEHQPLLVVGEAVPLREQGRGEALHAGQRRAQLVGDGGDQLGPAALLAGPAAGAPQRRRRRG